jgi:hypothetical protein
LHHANAVPYGEGSIHAHILSPKGFSAISRYFVMDWASNLDRHRDQPSSFVIVAFGIDATQAPILSQVAFSLILPVPMTALLILTRRRDVMGSCASGFLDGCSDGGGRHRTRA